MSKKRATKNVQTALKRITPYARDVGFKIKKEGSYYSMLYLPAVDKCNDDIPSHHSPIQTLGEVAYYISQSHHNAEEIRREVNWKGRTPSATRLGWNGPKGLDWLRAAQTKTK